MTTKEIIYIAAICAIAVYAIVLTVFLIVINSKFKKTNTQLSEKIQNTDKKIDDKIEVVDNRFNTERESTDKKIGEIFDNAMTATTMLMDEKVKNITEKMDDISLKLNIMDSTVKNLEREKVAVKTLIGDGNEPVEVHYHDVPKDGFVNNARKVAKNAVKSGSDIVNAIKKVFKK